LQRDASFAGHDKAVDLLNVFDGNHWLRSTETRGLLRN
jgi:hypothetical protein